MHLLLSNLSKFARQRNNLRKLDDALFVWFIQESERGTPLSGVILQEKAIHLNKMLNRSDSFLLMKLAWALRVYLQKAWPQQLNQPLRGLKQIKSVIPLWLVLLLLVHTQNNLNFNWKICKAQSSKALNVYLMVVNMQRIINLLC